jgi:K+-sensing histidine kinase KdpD
MKGFGFALEQRWEQMSASQRALMLGGIVYDAERMDTVLRQVVDAARVFEGRFEAFPEQTDVPDLVRQMAEMLARDPEHPSIEWSGDDVSAFVDPARLKTTLLALIEAAVWWGQSGPVNVGGSVDAGHLRVSVSRAGTALSSEGAQNLFLAQRPGSGGGSKIGLYIASSVAKAQGGRAWGEVVDDRLVLHIELPTG